MPKVLAPQFFSRPTSTVAQKLIGKWLVRRIGRHTIAGMITDVEVYDGSRDRGSHASRGMTARNAPMFGRPGVWYVYFTYGMHWMLNVVTREKGYPAAVLIRAVRLIDVRRQSLGVGGRRTDGPARLTKHFKIDKRFNSKQATRETGLWIEDRGNVGKSNFPTLGRIECLPRVGIPYAGPYWSRRKWRFCLREAVKKEKKVRQRCIPVYRQAGASGGKRE